MWRELLKLDSSLRIKGGLRRFAASYCTNAAARLVSDTGKSEVLHDDLHWLDVSQRVQFKLAVTVNHCLWNRAPTYVTDYCVQSLKSPGVIIYDQPCSFTRHSSVAETSVGLYCLESYLRVHQSGTRFRTVCATRCWTDQFRRDLGYRWICLLDVSISCFPRHCVI